MGTVQKTPQSSRVPSHMMLEAHDRPEVVAQSAPYGYQEKSEHRTGGIHNCPPSAEMGWTCGSYA